MSVSGFGGSLVVQRQSDPCINCTISLTSPMVKDDSSETGKSFIFRLYIDTPHIEKLYFRVRSYSGDTACEL